MLRSTLLALALCVPHWAAAQVSFDRIVAFGTSLSDPGNAFALVGAANTPHNYDNDPLLVPGSPYAHGGHHFSNGATWVEQFARSRGMAGNARPAFASAGEKAANYAVGGARANDTADTIDLGEQVGAFLRDHDGVAPSSALYVIEIGGNDIRDAAQAYLTAGGGDPGKLAAGAVLMRALESVGGNMFALYRAGARKFLVWNVPNLGLTPAIRTLDFAFPGTADSVHDLVLGFNDGLAAALAGLAPLPGIELIAFDIYSKVNEIVAQPGDFGLNNVRAACLTPLSAPSHCPDFNSYLFWDGIHPTTATHAIVAQHAAAVLAR